MTKKHKIISISVCLEGWLNDLLILKAKNSGESKSQIIRTLIKDSLVRAKSQPRMADNSGYYNDPKTGILRSVNKY